MSIARFDELNANVNGENVSEDKQEAITHLSNLNHPFTFFKTTKLNKDAKPFVPQENPAFVSSSLLVQQPPAKTNNFRNSKANIYRRIVANDYKQVKDKILKNITVGTNFFCCECEGLRPLQYARLAHLIPLKQLWINFEKENNVEMDCNSPDWRGKGNMIKAWKNYHHKNAKLQVVCKDCETKMTQQELPSTVELSRIENKSIDLANGSNDFNNEAKNKNSCL
jgi:hypothetical protein